MGSGDFMGSSSLAEIEDALKKVSNGVTSIVKLFLERIDETLEEIGNERKSAVFAILYSSVVPIQREHVHEIYLKFKHCLENKLRDDIQQVDVVLHTAGGDADAAFHIGFIMQKCIEEKEEERGSKLTLNIIVPRLAKSAGTLLALSGDNILLTRVSELGPIDPQIPSERGEYVSAKTIRDSLRQLIDVISEKSSTKHKERRVDEKITEELLKRIPVTEMGHYESLIKHVSILAKELLSNRMFKENESEKKIDVKKIVSRLVKGYEYHGHAITYWHLRSMNIKCELLPPKIEEKTIKIYEIFLNMQKTLNPLLIPFYVSLPEPIGRYAYKSFLMENGITFIPSPEELAERYIGKLVESLGAHREKSSES